MITGTTCNIDRLHYSYARQMHFNPPYCMLHVTQYILMSRELTLKILRVASMAVAYMQSQVVCQLSLTAAEPKLPAELEQFLCKEAACCLLYKPWTSIGTPWVTCCKAHDLQTFCCAAHNISLYLGRHGRYCALSAYLTSFATWTPPYSRY